MHNIIREMSLFLSLFMNVSNLRDAHCSKDPNVESHIFKLHRELRDDDRDTHDPYPAQRSKRIPQRARRSLAEGQHGVQAEAMSGSGHVCRGNRASWLLKITTWLLLAQHIQLACWKGVCGLAGIQRSSLDLPAHPMERNETDLSAHSIPGKSGQEQGGRLINHNSLASTSPFPITPETEDYLGEPSVASVQFRLGFCIRLALTTNTWNSVLLFEPVTVRE